MMTAGTATAGARGRHGRRAAWLGALTLSAVMVAPWAEADAPNMALALRAGTTGHWPGLRRGARALFPAARVGYSGFDYDHSVNTSDVNYAGRFRLSMPSAILDWHVFGAAFT